MIEGMKAVIMAGGLGKRIASINSTLPKPLIPINNKPILQWEIECLVRHGVKNIILTVYHMAEKIQEYFQDGKEFGCHIEYFVEKERLGNAGALFKLHKAGKLSDDFLLLNADSMFDVDINRFISFHKMHLSHCPDQSDYDEGRNIRHRQHGCNKQNKQEALATLLTHPNNHPYDSGLILTDKEGIVRQWFTKEDERPQYYKNCVNAGLHIINTEIFSLSGIDPDSIDAEHKVDLDRDVLKPLLHSGRIFAYNSPEYVKDMGTPERFKQVEADLLSGKIQARNLEKPQKAIFLDRDGTINKEVGFLRDIDDFELLPGVAEAIRRINSSGYLAIVVTNQPVIARGEVSFEELDQIHHKMETLLGAEGVYLDAIYYCPHHPDKGFEGEVVELKINCDCRKPKPGMLLRAAHDFNIDLGKSLMIGDKDKYVMAGKAAGCQTVWISNSGTSSSDADFAASSGSVHSGPGAHSNTSSSDEYDLNTLYADNLLEAVNLII